MLLILKRDSVKNGGTYFQSKIKPAFVIRILHKHTGKLKLWLESPQSRSPGQAPKVDLAADVGAWTQNHPQPDLRSHQDKGPRKVNVSNSQDT